jgi:heparosan-N-sulfate-glucuronate 5-epimerase
MTSSSSQLTFWHDAPTVEPSLKVDELGPYYMRFAQKANYDSLLDADGVPMLDYRGIIGHQYNPIAIAQYALGNHTLWLESQDESRLSKLKNACDWLVDNLEPNGKGVPVWLHKFDFEYAETLRAPWYSGLAQGQGISALIRCHAATQDSKYLEAAKRAFESLTKSVDEGGVIFTQGEDVWIEEYIVSKPTHILNGYIWAMWGVRDLVLATGDPAAEQLWTKCVATLERNLPTFDLGYWSLYDQSSNGILKMITSTFYHRLHIVQLQIMWQLTNIASFRQTSQDWDAYTGSRINRLRAKAGKAIFKLLRF